jgi:hypothetical protein
MSEREIQILLEITTISYLQCRRNVELGPDLLIEPLDEVGREERRLFLDVLVDKEVKVLKAGFFPFGDAVYPLVEPRAIGVVMIRTNPTDECRRRR